MIYGLTKGTDFEKLCDGAAKAEMVPPCGL